VVVDGRPQNVTSTAICDWPGVCLCALHAAARERRRLLLERLPRLSRRADSDLVRLSLLVDEVYELRSMSRPVRW